MKPSDAPTVIDRIRPMGFSDDDGIKLLVYGRSGTGKTTLAASAPGNTLWMVASGGLLPGELRSVDTPENRERISEVVLHGPRELDELVEYVNTSGAFHNVVLDHATGADEVPVAKVWGTASQQQYGAIGVQFKEQVRRLMTLRCNVIIIAHEKVFNGEGTEEMIKPVVGAGLMPSLTDWMNGAADYIVQTFIRQKTGVKQINVGGTVKEQRVKLEEYEYCLRVGTHSVFQTKFRVPRGTPLPEVLVDADFAQIMDLIRGRYGAEPAAEGE
jgi:hypothetical protein